MRRPVRSPHQNKARWVDQDLNIWIGVRDDDDESRANVYRFENILFDKFPALSFDFHVVSLVAGRKLDDFVSAIRLKCPPQRNTPHEPIRIFGLPGYLIVTLPHTLIG